VLSGLPTLRCNERDSDWLESPDKTDTVIETRLRHNGRAVVYTCFVSDREAY
jgi:hypothetical protein